jgi:ubiquitin carboxyl-terminal hydrolase 4/11/15
VADNAGDAIVMHQLPCQVIQGYQGTRVVTKKGQDLVIVPVYTFPSADRKRQRSETPCSLPFFIALTMAQSKDPQEIRRIVAERFAGLVSLPTEMEWDEILQTKTDNRDGEDALAQSVAETVDELTISQSESDGRRNSSDTRLSASSMTGPRRLADILDLGFYGSRRLGDGALAHDIDHSRRDSISERRQPKAGMMHRVRSAFDRFAGSSPPSEDEEEKPPQQLVFQNDIIAVEWKDNFVLEHFMGSNGLGRYDSKEAFLKHVDGAIEIERRRVQTRSQKGVTLDDCLDEFEREETLGENDLWYCSNVSVGAHVLPQDLSDRYRDSQCKKHQAATKKMEIYHAPDILVICFKRFSSSGSYYRSKVSRSNGAHFEVR